LSQKQVVTIGVAGGTASGKTTISQAILERVGRENITHLLHDSYYKPLAQILAENPHLAVEDINFDHPDSLDTNLLIEHLRQLKAWQSVEVPIYDFVIGDRKAEAQLVEPRSVLLVEGILVLADDSLGELFDIKIFVDTPDDIRFIRRLKRDIEERGRSVESVIEQYLHTVRPMHLAFVEPSKRHADVIIPQGGYNPVATEMIADRVRGILGLR
jgi:uridine kinase